MNEARPATLLWREALAQVDLLLQQEEPQRAAALATLAHTQPHLHSLVSSLLRAQATAESSGFLEPREAALEELRAGATLGPYRIVSLLGSGGMGEVWLAHRDDGLFEGQVAIKTLHPWLARGAIRARFLREAQLSGRISHPNIARLLDAGVSDRGAVYLVLEFVRGVPLDEYCDQRRLGIEARLQLFLSTCAAVAHAHSHLIVHRDLKPSNILVTADGEVKLLDFGVATLLDAEAAAASDLTRLTGRAFTPEFAAPEQLRGEPITTATDVYSLGVILYLLLTGQRPHVPRAEGNAALEHAVLHEEATLPSRIPRDTDREVAAARATTTPRLRRAMAGDLDNIVLRALEKRPADRYSGVTELAADVERHLRHVPVLARAATLRYRAAKFLRRNRLAASIGSLALLAVIAGALLAVWQANVAQVEARKANAIRDFLVGVFERNSVAHPEGARARKTTAEELLAQSAQEIHTGLADSPEVRRELLGVMARLYSSLDLQPKAIELLDDKLAAERRTYGEQSMEVAKTLSELAYSQVQMGEYEKAEVTARQALAIFESHGDTASLEHALAYGNLGQAAYRLGTGPDTVRDNYAAGLAIVERHHPENKRRIEMLLGLARAADLEQKHELALAYCDQALKLIETHRVEADGIVHGLLLQTKGYMLSWLKRYDESDALYLQAIAQFDRAGGADHPFAADARRELGSTYTASGRRLEGKKLLGEALASLERIKGADDPELTVQSRMTYSAILFQRGELAEAEPHMVRAHTLLRGSDKVLRTHAIINLVRLYIAQGRFAEANALTQGLESLTVNSYGKGSWMHVTALARIGELQWAEGHLAEARLTFEQIGRDLVEPPGELTNFPAMARLGLLRIALSTGDPNTARAQASRLLDDIEHSKGRREMPDESAAAHMLLGVALLRTGDAVGARPHLERAVNMRETMDAPQSLRLAEARLYLARALFAQGDAAGARRLLEQAAEAHRLQVRVGPQYSRLLADTRALLASTRSRQPL